MFDPNPKLDALLRQLLHPSLKVIDPGLERVERLLAAMGNPQYCLPPVVHVAGTNGKGSVIAYLKAILEAAGYHVHRYTSPHLVHFNERIMVGGRPIDSAYLAELLCRILALQHDYPATFFEATTAAAFLAFAEIPADIVLLETGMGGRLDATNVVPKPAATIIMPIGMDHAEYLGDSIAKIAYEKAAIMKPGVAAVIAPQPAEAMEVIEAYAETIGARLYRAGKEWHTQKDGSSVCEWKYNSRHQSQRWPLPALPGEHQIANAATALAVVEMLEEFTISRESAVRGLVNAEWPGRLQSLPAGYWRDMLPQGFTLMLDGGHNPMAATALAAWAKSQRVPVYLVVGMLSTKDAYGFLAPWAGIAEVVHCVSIPGEESHSSAALQAFAESCGLAACAYQNPEDAVQALAGKAPGIVLICGSLYLAGYVLHRQSVAMPTTTS